MSWVLMNQRRSRKLLWCNLCWCKPACMHACLWMWTVEISLNLMHSEGLKLFFPWKNMPNRYVASAVTPDGPNQILYKSMEPFKGWNLSVFVVTTASSFPQRLWLTCKAKTWSFLLFTLTELFYSFTFMFLDSLSSCPRTEHAWIKHRVWKLWLLQAGQAVVFCTTDSRAGPSSVKHDSRTGLPWVTFTFDMSLCVLVYL